MRLCRGSSIAWIVAQSSQHDFSIRALVYFSHISWNRILCRTGGSPELPRDMLLTFLQFAKQTTAHLPLCAVIGTHLLQQIHFVRIGKVWTENIHI